MLLFEFKQKYEFIQINRLLDTKTCNTLVRLTK